MAGAGLSRTVRHARLFEGRSAARSHPLGSTFRAACPESRSTVRTWIISKSPPSCAKIGGSSTRTRRLAMSRLAVAFFLLITAVLQGADSPNHLLMQQPTLSKTNIVFVFGGDLWSVPRMGGEARRLTSGPGRETNPHFSPDGSLIAFTGEYDGNVDAYVMPAAGGVPRRLTWHPAPDIVLDWTPDGKRILLTS